MKFINVKFNLLLLTGAVILLASLQSCDGIFPSQSKPPVPADHSDNISGVFHKPEPSNTENCTECHGNDLRGGIAEVNGQQVYANSCYQCHNDIWHRNGGGGGLIKGKLIK